MAPRPKKSLAEVKSDFELPQPGSEPPRKKKKKKNASDKPEPERIIPPDEEDPVIDPNLKSEAKRLRDENERDRAISTLQYDSVTAPMKPPPPDLLLTLVGAFLTSYGFNSTSRLYTAQLQSKQELALESVKLPIGFPDLVKIFKEWHKGYQERLQAEETSSSSSDNSDSAKVVKTPKKKIKVSKKVKAEAKANGATAATVMAKDITGSSGSESSHEDIESDVEMKDTTPLQNPKRKTRNLSKINPSSSSTSKSSSDSDADDEKDNAGAQLPIHAASQKPKVNGLMNSIKRTAGSGSTSSSTSESESDTSLSAGVKAVLVKKEAPSSVLHVASQPQSTFSTSKLSGSSSSSTDTSSSESDNAAVHIKPAAATTAVATAASRSSSDSTSSDSDSNDEAPKPTPTTKTATKAKTPSSSSSSKSTPSDSESSKVDVPKPPTTKTTTTTQISSDSSATLQPNTKPTPSSTKPILTSIPSSDPSTPAIHHANTTAKRKRSPSPASKAAKFPRKKENVPFQRVPRDTVVDPKMASNAYRSYDYADRAHQDLSVTKGKGFTKEKNKKKRGSYRGGVIDVSGGKGIKFED